MVAWGGLGQNSNLKMDSVASVGCPLLLHHDKVKLLQVGDYLSF